MSDRRASNRLKRWMGVPVVATTFMLALNVAARPAQAQCSYSVGSSPTLTGSVSGPDEVEPGAGATFTATAADQDNYDAGGEGGQTTVADSTTISWTASDGSPTGPTRSSSFTWTAPTLGANENERTVTITAQADDVHTSNPCPGGCGGCSGNRNDAPGQTAQKTVTVRKPKVCDNDSNGGYDDWYQCATNNGEIKDACYVCDKNGDNIKDGCYQCDTDGNGSKDACYRCDNNGDGIKDDCNKCDSDGNMSLDICYICDNNKDGIHDDCTHCNGNTTCYLADSNDDGINDSCSEPCNNDGLGGNDDIYRCDTDNDGHYDACYTSDTDGDGVKDSCCPNFRVKIVPADDFTGRSYTKVGVGETGTIQLVAANGVNPTTLTPVTYSSSNGGCISVSGNTFTAGGNGCSSNLCATVGGCKQCVSVQVVEPRGVVMEKEAGTCVWHEINTGSVGFKARAYITPANVSFSNIQVREEAASLSVSEPGYFYFQKGWPHEQGSFTDIGPMVPGKGTADGSTDEVVSGPHAGPFGSGGSFEWTIPWSYKLGAVEKQFTIVTQSGSINSSGNMTLSKGGYSASKAFSDASSSNNTTFTCP